MLRLGRTISIKYLCLFTGCFAFQCLAQGTIQVTEEVRPIFSQPVESNMNDAEIKALAAIKKQPQTESIANISLEPFKNLVLFTSSLHSYDSTDLQDPFLSMGLKKPQTVYGLFGFQHVGLLGESWIRKISLDVSLKEDLGSTDQHVNLRHSMLALEAGKPVYAWSEFTFLTYAGVQWHTHRFHWQDKFEGTFEDYFNSSAKITHLSQQNFAVTVSVAATCSLSNYVDQEPLSAWLALGLHQNIWSSDWYSVADTEISDGPKTNNSGVSIMFGVGYQLNDWNLSISRQNEH